MHNHIEGIVQIGKISLYGRIITNESMLERDNLIVRDDNLCV